MYYSLGQITVSNPKPPFWQLATREQRTAAALLAIQKVLSLPATGKWDQATHDAVFGWYAANHPGSVFPEWGTDPESTAMQAVAIVEEISENPVLGTTLKSALGVAPDVAISADGGAAALGELAMTVGAQEASAASAGAKGLSTTSLVIMMAGVLLFGGIFGYGLATTVKPKATAAPASA